MKRSLLGVAVLILLASPNVLSQDHFTTIVASLTNSGDSIVVHANILLDDPGSGHEVTLLLNPSAVVHTAKFLNERDSVAALYTRTQGDTIVVARPTDPEFSYSRVLAFQLAYPLDLINDSLIMLDRGNRWYPVLPHGLTNALINIVSSSDREVFSTGEKSTQQDFGVLMHQFITKIPVYKIPIVIARKGFYRSCVREVAGHEIRLCYFSLADSTAQQVLAKAASAFEFYQNMLGNYHHTSLTILEAPDFEGTNIGTAILMIGSPTLKAIAEGQDEALTLTIAAQWFGAGVFCDFPSKGFWFMSLSLSHYLRMLYESRDLDSADFGVKIAANLMTYTKIAGDSSDVAIIDIVRPDSREKGAVIYSKGPAIVHRLRTCVGTEQWNVQIRGLYRDYLGKIISLDDFVTAFTAPNSDCAEQLRRGLARKGL